MNQIQRVENLSDAYHLSFGDTNVMVAYLLEVRRKEGGQPDGDGQRNRGATE